MADLLMGMEEEILAAAAEHSRADELTGRVGAVDNAAEPGSVRLMEAGALDRLFESLHEAGYLVIGPTVRDGAIVLDELAAASALPFGWGVNLGPGGYRLRRRDDTAAFGHSAGPGSWKQFLHPPREKLWSSRLADGGFEIEQAGSDSGRDPEPPRLAFFGVRPCDLRAIQIQDQVLGGGRGNSRYADRRSAVLIVAVNCTEPGETCFCTSMGTGPAAGTGYDLALTELVSGEWHAFLVDVGTEATPRCWPRTHDAGAATIDRARRPSPTRRSRAAPCQPPT
jgi:hypothetical protein